MWRRRSPRIVAVPDPDRLRDRVIWGGHVSDAATLAAIYRATDLLVLPSDHEPWALVINEAAAAGLAIVSSNVPGASAELVRDGRNGHIFPAGDVAALADCLRDATRSDKIDAMKSESPRILAEWRQTGDPIQGLRARHGVLRRASSHQPNCDAFSRLLKRPGPSPVPANPPREPSSQHGAIAAWVATAGSLGNEVKRASGSSHAEGIGAELKPIVKVRWRLGENSRIERKGKDRQKRVNEKHRR